MGKGGDALRGEGEPLALVADQGGVVDEVVDALLRNAGNLGDLRRGSTDGVLVADIKGDEVEPILRLLSKLLQLRRFRRSPAACDDSIRRRLQQLLHQLQTDTTVRPAHRSSVAVRALARAVCKTLPSDKPYVVCRHLRCGSLAELRISFESM